MSVNRSNSRLPDELIIEIFRNRVLASWDLANCALVSRRYVKPVRRFLYECVEVVVMEDLGLAEGSDYEEPGAQEGSRLDMAYSEMTWSLLKALMGNRTLGLLIKELDFQVEDHYTGCDDEDHSPVATTPIHALSTFIRLAPNVKKVKYGGPYVDVREALRKLCPFKGVASLTIPVIGTPEFDYMTKNLVHLRHLETFHLNVRTPAARLREYPSHFVTLAILEGSRECVLPFVQASSKTLRSLTLDISIALDITYSDFPQLSHLEICGYEILSVSTRAHEIYSKHRKFWTSLCDSASLDTLSFKSVDRSPSDRFRSIFSGDPLWSDTSIPTLKTIRFKEHALLDRIEFLLSCPLAKTLHRLVLPFSWYWFSRESGNRKMRAVVGMCEGTQIQVCVADD